MHCQNLSWSSSSRFEEKIEGVRKLTSTIASLLPLPCSLPPKTHGEPAKGSSCNMFSSMSVASAPTSSLQQREVEGEELDAPVRSSLPFLLCLLSPTLTRALFLFRLQWLDLRKPSIDTHARLHEPINLEGLPSECNLFDVSSKKGVFVAAGMDGELHSSVGYP